MTLINKWQPIKLTCLTVVFVIENNTQQTELNDQFHKLEIISYRYKVLGIKIKTGNNYCIQLEVIIQGMFTVLKLIQDIMI